MGLRSGWHRQIQGCWREGFQQHMQWVQGQLLLLKQYQEGEFGADRQAYSKQERNKQQLLKRQEREMVILFWALVSCDWRFEEELLAVQQETKQQHQSELCDERWQWPLKEEGKKGQNLGDEKQQHQDKDRWWLCPLKVEGYQGQQEPIYR